MIDTFVQAVADAVTSGDPMLYLIVGLVAVIVSLVGRSGLVRMLGLAGSVVAFSVAFMSWLFDTGAFA